MKHMLLWFTLVLMLLNPSMAQMSESGLDYSLEVDQWWAKHHFNPASNHYVEDSPSPAHIVNIQDFSGNLQKAINALPECGGTVILPEGEYVGGFEIIGRQNVHLVGKGKVKVHDGENWILGSTGNKSYEHFNKAVFRKSPEALRVMRELPAQNIVLKNITFANSPVRLASCRNIVFENCTFQKKENRDVGAKDESGKKVLRWYRPLAVTGIMGLQEIWFRNCDFAGHYAETYYLDGAHFSGAVNCRFAGSEKHWMNSVVLFTNDDFSLDVNGNNTLEPWERRDIRYYVFDGCQFGGGHPRGAIASSGREILIQNCTVKGKLGSLLVSNAKTSGKDIEHEAFGIKVLNNNLPEVNNIVIAEGAKNRPEKGLPEWWVWKKYKIGKITIRDNKTGQKTQPLREMPYDSEILGPHEIEGNGPSAIGATSPTQPLLTFVFAGQSNMVGKRCKPEKLPKDLQKENPAALFFDAKKREWTPIAPGKTEVSGFGPEIAFAAAMSKAIDRPIGIIKHSRGGTNLDHQWNPENPKSLFVALSQQVETARQLRPIQVVGMIWVQGGADSKSGKMANAYADNLKKFIQNSRKQFQNPDMHFLSGRIPPKSSKTKPHWKLVRNAQQDLQLPGYQWVDCDDISTGSDNIHYDEAGMVKLGERQAKMMLEMLKVHDEHN